MSKGKKLVLNLTLFQNCMRLCVSVCVRARVCVCVNEHMPVSVSVKMHNFLSVCEDAWTPGSKCCWGSVQLYECWRVCVSLLSDRCCNDMISPLAASSSV